MSSCDQVLSHLLVFWLFIPSLQGVDGFFIKHFSGWCLVAKEDVSGTGAWWIHYLMELQGSCLDKRGQFRFKENDAIYNLNGGGCFAIYPEKNHLKNTLFLYEPRDKTKLSRACNGEWVFKQTSGASLLLLRKYNYKQDHCVAPYTKSMISKLTDKNKGNLLQATLACDEDNQRFTFGSVTCDKDQVIDVNCPQRQVITINSAFYGGSNKMKACNYTEDENCLLDVTYSIKDLCEGKQNCSGVTVNEKLFAGTDPCPGKKKYLYFEYQCFNKSFSTTNGTDNNRCSERILGNKDKVPDSSFTSSHQTLPGHEAFKARLSSSASWCVQGGEEHYLEINLGKPIVIYNVTTLGDSGTENLVRSFKLNYTVDFSQWKTARYKSNEVFPGNIDGFKQAVTRKIDDNITARAVRFLPIHSYHNSCMRVEMCGNAQFPSRPTNLRITNTTPTAVWFSWTAPVDGGDGGVIEYCYNITGPNNIVRSKTIQKDTLSSHEANLTPYSTYHISIIARNQHGFSERTTKTFNTKEAAQFPNRPTNLRITNTTPTAVWFSWTAPVDGGDGGVIEYWYNITGPNNIVRSKTIQKDTLSSHEANLTPYSTYHISIIARNQHGFSERTTKTFNTKEADQSISDKNSASTASYIVYIVGTTCFIGGLVCGIMLVYVVLFLRRRTKRGENVQRENDSSSPNYENVGAMNVLGNGKNNCQSLEMNTRDLGDEKVNEAGYAELNTVRENKDDHYQALKRAETAVV